MRVWNCNKRTGGPISGKRIIGNEQLTNKKTAYFSAGISEPSVFNQMFGIGGVVQSNPEIAGYVSQIVSASPLHILSAIPAPAAAV
jgi:hypothetical protein